MSRLLVGLALAASLAAGEGCARAQRNEDFVPTEDVARSALDAYLRDWSRGQTGGAVPGTNPPVVAVDELSQQKGRTLKKYTILGATPADAPLCFAVTLSLGNPEQEVRERYVVVGLNPLWVWRYDDYLMIAHWSHPMPDPKAPAQKK